MAPIHQSPDVLVIGAGVVGAAIAHELARRGVRVTVTDEGADIGNGCSHANAGLLSPDHVEPLTTPANLTTGLRYLLAKDSPFHLSPSPRLVPWLLRFAAASTPGRARRLTETMRELARESLQQHRDYAADGLDTGLQESGSLDIFLTPDRFEAMTDPDQGDHGERRVLSAVEARALVPGLGDVAGAVLHEKDASCETRSFVRACLDSARRAGATVRWRTAVHHLLRQGDRVVGAEADGGRIHAGAVVVAAGLGSAHLVEPFGARLPLTGGKGYVVDVARQAAPPLPLTFKELKVVATPYPDRLRFCGTMDLGETSDRIVPSRVEAIRRAATIGLPAVDTGRPLQVWAGQRPCTADGIPVIGRLSRATGLHLATGHGMWGLILAPVTAAHLADMLCDGPSDSRFEAFTPDRFAR